MNFNHSRILLTLGIILVSLLAAACTVLAPLNDAQKPEIHLEDCQLSAPGVTSRLKARCGNLTVYEDRDSNQGRKIELHISVVPATSRNPAPDPLFFIPGGPGEAATQAFLSVSDAFTNIKQKRNIILVDQRGTGKSHPLRCPNESDELLEPDDKETEKVIQDCLNQLDADPRLYTTPIAMEDLDQVRQALGYEQINLYGASYGTRAALVYLRKYPERVRSLILDGAAPTNWTLGPSVPADGQRALEAIIMRCEDQLDCQGVFPNFSQEFASLLQQLENEPVIISLDHPINGEPINYEMTHQRFANTIHSMSYIPETVALIPLFVHSAYVQGDYSRLAAIALSNSSLLEESISAGMRFSVICAEDVPFYENEAITTGYLDNEIVESFKDICEIWPKGSLPAGYKEPVRSDIPVLILSGESDPVTPPANGELVAQTLPNSLHVISPGMGHINIFRGCIPAIATQFIESGTASNLDITCVQNIKPLPFFINFNGPPP
jgi:pimeloyl-ACP methyl ester carboxylesterase